MKIILIGTIEALETINDRYTPDTEVLEIIKDLRKADELERVTNKIIEGCM